MSRSATVFAMSFVLVLAVSGSVHAQTTWVAVAAHNAGLEESEWRTDAGVLNMCDGDATVEITLHTEAGEITETFVIEGGRQQIFEDVVAQLVDGEANGALELVSDLPVSVTSRTFNQGPNGTFGQSLEGVDPADGLTTGQTHYLQQLRQDGAFRTNLGVLNMGAEPLTVEVTLYDRLGAEVGVYQLEVPGGQTVQDNRPYLQRYGRSDIVGGYARVTVLSGGGAWLYASVVDDMTNDPTTITSTPEPECPVDIADRLAAIDGMTVLIEGWTPEPGYRYFALRYDQPVDHDDPGGARFTQYMTLLHRSYDAPMVMRTSGYTHSGNNRNLELTRMLGANQLGVEHRFFGSSTPAPLDWSLLDIEQAAEDHHRIVEALAPVYTGAWLTTGYSKGGMTAVFHRYFYPDDVDATVPYVAPISFGAPDERYVDFLATRGEAECRQALVDIQREALTRREAMLDLFDEWADQSGATYERIGGRERAFESTVAELPFTFWQYAGEDYCPLLPGTDASDGSLFEALALFSSFTYPSDQDLAFFDPYFYQAHTELGFPDLDFSHLDDLLTTDPLNLEEGLPPEGTSPTYDPSVMLDVADWVATEGLRLMFVYGENDPYTAGAFELGEAEDSYVFTVAGGTHGADIEDLGQDDQQQIREILERWTGVTPVKSLGDAVVADSRRGRGPGR